MIILDTTLREGELQPGIYFKKESREKIAQSLAEIGTPRIELPLIYPERGGEKEDIKSSINIIQENYDKTAVLQFRAFKNDVDLSQEYDAEGCALYLAPTGAHRNAKLNGLDEDGVINTFVETLELAKSYGFTYRRAVLEDASRFDCQANRDNEDNDVFIKRLLAAVKDAGATIVSIPDTSGILALTRCQPFIESVSKSTDLPIACHFHNDYGNALANALQAILIPQVEEIHVSIIGLGARNGITDHYEFIANVEDLLHLQSGERREGLASLYKTFSDVTGIPIPINHPLGPHCFVEKAGTHQSQVLKDASGYIPADKLHFDSPNGVRFEAGQLMSKHIVASVLENAVADGSTDFSFDQETIKAITETIAKRSALKHHEISPWEIKEIIQLKTGVKVEIDKLQKLIRGHDYTYIMLRLLPQFSTSELIQEVGSWNEVERVDRVFGGADVIVYSKLADVNGTHVISKIREKFGKFILEDQLFSIE